VTGPAGGNGSGPGSGPAPDEQDGLDDAGDPVPAHGRRRRRAPRPARDLRSLPARLPVLAVVGVVLAGAVALERGDDGGGGAGAVPVSSARPEAVVPAAAPASAGSSTWYCAAGTAVADGAADHVVVMVNPGPADRRAALTVYRGDVAAQAPPADPVTQDVDLPAGTRVVARLGDVVDSPLAAALVEVDGGGVAVEHQVTGPSGGDVAPCATTAADTWHFAWGETSRDARETIVLFNPFPTEATVEATFATEDGGREPVRFQGFPVPARSVVGVDLGEDVTRSGQVSATFRVRGGRIVAERLQEFDGTLGRGGLSLALGVPEAAATWVFADGEASAPTPEAAAPDAASSDSDSDEDPDSDADSDEDAGTTAEKIVVYNPGDGRAHLAVIVLPTTDEPGPLPQPFGLSVGPGDYEVVDYGAEDRIVAGVPHATVVRVTAGAGVVAERVTTDGDAEVTAAPGARFADRTWTFPTTVGGDAAATLVVFNPDPTRAVRATLRPAVDGADPLVEPVDVPPGGRATLEVDPDALADTTGVVVTAAGPVVVERVLPLPDGGGRLALGAGIPAAATAVSLDALAEDAGLAGVPPPG
jgi:Family of unknown function (DUF5719)